MIDSKLIENSNDYFAIFCSKKFVLLICIITIIDVYNYYYFCKNSFPFKC